jgi:hypothetical protein
MVFDIHFMGAVFGFLGSFPRKEYLLSSCYYGYLCDFGAIFVASLLCAQSMAIRLKKLALSALRLHIVAVR